MQNDKTTEAPPVWAYTRAYGLARCVSAYEAFARYIAEHETAPVDPLLIEAREIVAKWCVSAGIPHNALAVRAGDDGFCCEVQAALAALERGVEIGRGEA